MPATATKAKKIDKGRIEAQASQQMIAADLLVTDPGKNPRFLGHTSPPDKVAKKFVTSPEFEALTRSFDRMGVQEAVLVEPRQDGKFDVLNGWCRATWAKQVAVQKPGFTVPCVVKRPQDDTGRTLLRIALNTARNSYDPMARANAFKRVADAMGGDLAAARACGVSITSFREATSLLRLPKQAQDLIADGRMTMQCGEQLLRLPGFKAYERKAGGEKGLDGKTVAEAAEFDRRSAHVLRLAEESEKTFSMTDLVSAWNGFTNKSEERAKAREERRDADEGGDDEKPRGKSAGKPKPKGEPKGEGKGKPKGDAKPAKQPKVTTDTVLTVEPSEAGLKAAMTFYGRALAEELLSAEPDDAVTDGLRCRMEHLSASLGWCVPKDLQTVMVNRKGKPLYSPEVAAQLCREVVAEFTLLGYLEMQADKSRVPKADDPMFKDQSVWTAFYKADRPLPSLLKDLDKHLAPEPRVAT